VFPWWPWRRRFLLREFLHVRVGHHFLRRVDVGLRLLVVLVQLHQRAQFRVLAIEFAVAVHIAGAAFLVQQLIDFDQALGQLVELGKQSMVFMGLPIVLRYYEGRAQRVCRRLVSRVRICAEPFTGWRGRQAR